MDQKGDDVAPETKQMPGKKMVEPPKGKKQKAGDMPSGAMEEPSPKKDGKK